MQRKDDRYTKRGANKRLQTSVYEYLQEEGQKTANEIAHWYNAVRKNADQYYARGRNQGTSARQVSNVMAKSLLFEKVGQTMFNGLVAVWDARPLDDVVDRAIASKKPVKKYPMFLQKAIQERLE